MKTQNGITENIKVVADRIIIRLTNEKTVHPKPKHIHWQGKSAEFGTKHSFYEEQIGQLDAMIDYVNKLNAASSL
jgi:DNA-binding ferritin-like protein